jgi:hypothetical protein
MGYPWVSSSEIGTRVYASSFDGDWTQETSSVWSSFKGGDLNEG